MAAFLIVRAEVDPAVRDAFDAWYRDEHLPEAVEAFGAAGAWRGWSDVDDNVHLACYEFADLADVSRVMGSDALKRMIGEFDRNWQGNATRTREVVDSVQTIRTAAPASRGPSHDPNLAHPFGMRSLRWHHAHCLARVEPVLRAPMCATSIAPERSAGDCIRPPTRYEQIRRTVIARR